MSAAAAQAIREMVASRGPGKMLCPGEAARALAGADGDSRARTDEVHAAADALLAANGVVPSWRGERLQERDGRYGLGAP